MYIYRRFISCSRNVHVHVHIHIHHVRVLFLHVWVHVLVHEHENDQINMNINMNINMSMSINMSMNKNVNMSMNINMNITWTSSWTCTCTCTWTWLHCSVVGFFSCSTVSTVYKQPMAVEIILLLSWYTIDPKIRCTLHRSYFSHLLLYRQFYCLTSAILLALQGLFDVLQTVLMLLLKLCQVNRPY
jgi:hypothetical protein